MAKKLCLSGVIISLLIFIVFTLDLSCAIPFSRANLVFDVVMLVSSLIVGVLGWLTYREQDQ